MRVLVALALLAILASTPSAAATSQTLAYVGAPGAPGSLGVCPTSVNGDSVCFTVSGARTASIVVRDAGTSVPAFDIVTYSNAGIPFTQTNFCGTTSGVNLIGVTHLAVQVHDGSRICIGGGLPTVGTVVADIT